MYLCVFLGDDAPVGRYHYLVPEWMKTASDAEKRGVIKLARCLKGTNMKEARKMTGWPSQ